MTIKKTATLYVTAVHLDGTASLLLTSTSPASVPAEWPKVADIEVDTGFDNDELVKKFNDYQEVSKQVQIDKLKKQLSILESPTQTEK